MGDMQEGPTLVETCVCVCLNEFSRTQAADRLHLNPVLLKDSGFGVFTTTTFFAHILFFCYYHLKVKPMNVFKVYFKNCFPLEVFVEISTKL